MKLKMKNINDSVAGLEKLFYLLPFFIADFLFIIYLICVKFNNLCNSLRKLIFLL